MQTLMMRHAANASTAEGAFAHLAENQGVFHLSPALTLHIIKWRTIPIGAILTVGYPNVTVCIWLWLALALVRLGEDMRQFTRRHFGLASSAGLVSIHLPIAAQSAPPQTIEQSQDDWLMQWKAQSKLNKDLQGPLDLRRFKDPFYALLNEIGWKPGKSGTELQAFRVPRGFVTDFASVPRPFWSIFPPDGKYAYAAVLHDWLYWEQDRPKAAADKIFRSAMDDLTITDSQAAVLYQAVNIFGGSAWSRNAELKKAGEKRVLAKLPEKPEITWVEWKTIQGVFK